MLNMYFRCINIENNIHVLKWAFDKEHQLYTYIFMIESLFSADEFSIITTYWTGNKNSIPKPPFLVYFVLNKGLYIRFVQLRIKTLRIGSQNYIQKITLVLLCSICRHLIFIIMEKVWILKLFDTVEIEKNKYSKRSHRSVDFYTFSLLSVKT